MTFDLTKSLMANEIAAKEHKLVKAEAVLRLAMMASKPGTQKKLLSAVWPSIQAIETSLLALRDVRDAEIGRMAA